jgi:hypothetical protein
MIEFRSVPGVLVAGFCLLGTAGLASASGVEDIVNYREYSAILSSSGQPTQAQLQAVADAGYERVVFLAFSDHDESLVNEDRLVKELGMEYAHIPVDWDAPRNSDFHMFAGLMARAKEDLNSVWVPNDTWRKFIFDVLEENGRSADCDSCLWE